MVVLLTHIRTGKEDYRNQSRSASDSLAFPPGVRSAASYTAHILAWRNKPSLTSDDEA